VKERAAGAERQRTPRRLGAPRLHRWRARRGRRRRASLTHRRRAAHTEGNDGGDMKYHLISASLLGAAFALETLGFAGGGILLGAGVGCEVWFWMRMVRSSRSSRASRAT
jgi:hypothetical protein